MMIEQIGDQWRRFWRRANEWTLAMDADPMEDLRNRIGRLELAVFQSAAEDKPLPPVPAVNSTGE
jgi:hypothetical protein